MELRCMRTFARIGEVGNFTRVAEELGYTQSAVTMQIKQLEGELGCTLFERLGRTVRLTPEGERLVPIAHQMLQAADEAARIAQDPGEVTGTLRIGATDSMLMSCLPQVLLQLAQTYPKVQISTHQGALEDEFAMLKRNDIDLLLFLDERIYRPEWLKALEVPGAARFYASAKNPLAKKRRIPLEDTLERPLYLTERNVSYRVALEQAIFARGLEVRPRIECGSTELLIQAAEQTDGVTFLPEYATRAAVAAGRLAPLKVDLEPLDLWHQLVYHRNKVVTPQMELFAHLVQERLGA